jgi:NAD dependent epimerase/dehydratase family
MLMKKIKVIVTGVTGMVGEGVVLECLQNPLVEAVLVLGRRSCGMTHAKLKEIVHADLYDISGIGAQLAGYDACYFCLGTSSIGMDEAAYTKVTYTLTMGIATVLSQHNPGMTLIYISGSGTDSSEKGRQMWARVKGKTENDLMKLPFKQVFAFRPGGMKATAGQKNLLKMYKWVAWMYPMLRAVAPGMVSTLQEVALAMIAVTLNGHPKKVLEVKDMVAASKTIQAA